MSIVTRGMGKGAGLVTQGYGSRIGGIIADIWKQIIRFRLILTSSRLGNR